MIAVKVHERRANRVVGQLQEQARLLHELRVLRPELLLFFRCRRFLHHAQRAAETEQRGSGKANNSNAQNARNATTG